MMSVTLAEIAECLQGGALIGADIVITRACIDTRSILTGDLYIAIKGESLDGHDFIVQAEKFGASAFIVNKEVATALPQIVVKDTRLALAELAGLMRDKTTAKVCAITGSNGKTTVKEMVGAILAVQASVLLTPGNFNNDIGVPLTLLKLNEAHQFAVIEMGANHQGEIAYSCQWAKPDVAVITNVGAAHIEGFGSLDGVATAKSEIIQSLSNNGIAVLNADDDFFSKWLKIAGKRRVVSFGFAEMAEVRGENIKVALSHAECKTQFDLLVGSERVRISLLLAGEHNVLNALAASAVCLSLGIDLRQISQGLQAVRSVSGRLQFFESEGGFKVINDSYNANPASLNVALDVLKNCSGELWLALGAFGELGAESVQQHNALVKNIKQAGVTRLFVIGADAKNMGQVFGDGAEYYDLQEDLIAAIKKSITKDVVLLIKGSRVQKMEVVVNALMVMAR